MIINLDLNRHTIFEMLQVFRFCNIRQWIVLGLWICKRNLGFSPSTRRRWLIRLRLLRWLRLGKGCIQCLFGFFFVFLARVSSMASANKKKKNNEKLKANWRRRDYGCDSKSQTSLSPYLKKSCWLYGLPDLQSRYKHNKTLEQDQQGRKMEFVRIDEATEEIHCGLKHSIVLEVRFNDEVVG